MNIKVRAKKNSHFKMVVKTIQQRCKNIIKRNKQTTTLEDALEVHGGSKLLLI